MTTKPTRTADLVTRDEAAEFLRVSLATLERLYLVERAIPYFKVGRRVLFKQTDLARYVEAQAVA